MWDVPILIVYEADYCVTPMPGRCGCGRPYEAASRLWVTLLYM